MSPSYGERNYYEILQSAMTATFDELKSNYKQLILQCHPDKIQQSDSAVRPDDADPISGVPLNENTFVCINKAWNTLKDPVKRKHYDAELLQLKFQMQNNIFERLKLSEMTRHADEVEDQDRDHDENVNGVDGDGDTSTNSNNHAYYTYNCRCGGQYIVDESEYYNHDCTDVANKDDSDNVDDDDADDEVIIECSECSLVIILYRDKKK